MTTDLALARFHDKYVIAPSGCWIWLHGRTNGYAAFCASGGKNEYGHRFAYEAFVGPIPEGFDIDHLCRTRRCVNPLHLQAVTRRVNLLRGFTLAAAHARKTHCSNGHVFDVANTGRRGPGGRWRECRRCRRDRQRVAA